MENLSYSLKIGGKVCIATDVLDYKNKTLEVFEQLDIFKRVHFNSTRKNLQWFSKENTKYERKAISEARTPFYLVYKKI